MPGNHRRSRKDLLRTTVKILRIIVPLLEFGVRLDGAMGDTGSIITPFYDSLLVKITTSGPNLNQALDRMHRALREMRITWSETLTRYSSSWKM